MSAQQTLMDRAAWFGRLLRACLGLVHVRHEPRLLETLERWRAEGQIELEVVPVWRRYAYRAAIEKR